MKKRENKKEWTGKDFSDFVNQYFTQEIQVNRHAPTFR